jgi:hypothetical protein
MISEFLITVMSTIFWDVMSCSLSVFQRNVLSSAISNNMQYANMQRVVFLYSLLACTTYSSTLNTEVSTFPRNISESPSDKLNPRRQYSANSIPNGLNSGQNPTASFHGDDREAASFIIT